MTKSPGLIPPSQLRIMSPGDLRIHLQTLTRMLERYTPQDQEVALKLREHVSLVRYLISIKEASDE